MFFFSFLDTVLPARSINCLPSPPPAARSKPCPHPCGLQHVPWNGSSASAPALQNQLFMPQSDCPCLEVGHSCQIPCAKISAHLQNPHDPALIFPSSPAFYPHSSLFSSDLPAIHQTYQALAG